MIKRFCHVIALGTLIVPISLRGVPPHHAKSSDTAKTNPLSKKVRALSALGGVSSLAAAIVPLYAIMRTGPALHTIKDNFEEADLSLKARGILQAFSYPAAIAASYCFAQLGQKLLKKATKDSPKMSVSYHSAIGVGKLLLAVGAASGPLLLAPPDTPFSSTLEKADKDFALISKPIGLLAAALLFISSGISFKKAYDSIPDELPEKNEPQDESLLGRLRRLLGI